MTIVFTVLSAGYAAYGLWLVVRIVNQREKQPKLKVALMAVPCVYGLSFGPMASLGRHGLIPSSLMEPVGMFYAPLIWFLNDSGPASAVLNWISTSWP